MRYREEALRLGVGELVNGWRFLLLFNRTVCASLVPMGRIHLRHTLLVNKKLAMPVDRRSEPLPISPNFPILRSTNEIIQSMTLVQKKKVMTGLRVGTVPKYSRRQKQKEALWRQHTDIIRILDRYAMPTKDIDMDDAWFMLAPFLATPVRRSILSTALRSAHLLPGEAEQAISDGVVKEISVTQRDDLLPSLQYPFFYSREACLRIPMHPDLPFRPFLLLLYRHRFLRLKLKLSSLLLIPRTTHKTCGKLTRERFWAAVYPNIYDWERPTTAITTANLEQLYMEEGIQVDGPCEVRYAWKYNDLKPRVYYAIGASAYNHAKYVHSVFDELVKISRSTHPLTRYTFAGFPQLSFPENTFIIYDYASFTSRMIDFKEFVREFAQFLEGTMVKVFDTSRGILEVDLGHLVHQYNDACNQNGEFCVTRIFDSMGVSSGEYVVLEHKVAGMLGVFGNIVGCTALHGIVGVQICGGDENGNFIGDDAGIACLEMERFEVYQIKESVRSIGEIADEKYEIFEGNDEEYEDSDSWHYTKRPIGVEQGGIKHGWMPEFPLLAPARGLNLDHVTVKLPEFRLRRRIFVRQVTRFLNSLTAHQDEVSEEDWDLVQFILKDCYRKLQLPIYGAIPKLENRWIDGRPHGDDVVVVPPILPDVLKKGWRQVLQENRDTLSGTMRIPRFDMEDQLPRELTEGALFVYRSEKVLSVLDKMHVVDKRLLVEERLVTEESLERYFDYIDGNLRPLYEYQVLRDYSPWSSYVDLMYPVSRC
jgi:hypothetical protein